MPLLGTVVICPSAFVTKPDASGSLRRVARRLNNPEFDKVASKLFSAAVLQAMLAPPPCHPNWLLLLTTVPAGDGEGHQ